LLGELFDRRRLLDDVVRNRGEPAVTLGAETQALDGRRAIADHREHLLAGERQLHRPAGGVRRQHGQHHGRVGEGLGAETAADVGRDDAHTLGLEPECRGDGIPDAVCALVRIVQGHAFAVVAPHCDGRVRLEWIVVIGRRRIREVERNGRRGQRGLHVSIARVRLEAGIDPLRLVETAAVGA